MVNYREILRLRLLYSQREIAQSVHSSRDTIREVFALSDEMGLAWPLPDDLTNEDIRDMLYPQRRSQSNRKTPDCQYMHRELARPGVTLTLLWSEYCEQCNVTGLIPYQYTQFCEFYRKYARATKATMRIKRKPGEILETDWAGNTLSVFDSITGETIPAYVFVATLACSKYSYAEAFPSMVTENWLNAHVHTYDYFGGATRIVTPDNLKTGIIKNTRYELITNRSYQEMAEHYGTAIIPARVRKPKDKPNAEGTVGIITTWIIAALRNKKFFTFEELNIAIREKLDFFNAEPFQKKEVHMVN
jgi:transposase